ncbi:MAG: DUF3108 domain-containing protein [Betaproteobacteria bacterium]|nr:DUF3108 domain-containing protein [Betaproteobacteria bacterium]
MNHEFMGVTMMLRTVSAVCIALMVVLSGMFPDVSRADNRKGVSAWPEKGAVDYRVSYGEGGMVIGQAYYSWEHNGEKYQMRLALETTGMAAMLYKLDYVQLSQGDIGKDGLRPLRFDVTQQGKTPEMALFDWNGETGARVSIRRGAEERHNLELAPGDQDILSIWRQIGHVGKLPDSLLVVGNKNARRAQVVDLGDVDLKVSAGRFATRHFSARSDDGKLKIDFWLANGHHMVPVRVILGGDKSEALVLEAATIRAPSPN